MEKSFIFTAVGFFFLMAAVALSGQKIISLPAAYSLMLLPAGAACLRKGRVVANRKNGLPDDYQTPPTKRQKSVLYSVWLFFLLIFLFFILYPDCVSQIVSFFKH